MTAKPSAGELAVCLHPNLHFGSGDYHLFCHNCHQTWTVVQHELANRGGATQLSGHVRASPPSVPGVDAVRDALETIKCHLYAVAPSVPWIADCRVIADRALASSPSVPGVEREALRAVVTFVGTLEPDKLDDD